MLKLDFMVLCPSFRESMLGITRLVFTASSSSLSSSWGQHLSTMVAFLLNPDRSTRAHSTQIPRAATHRLVLVTDRYCWIACLFTVMYENPEISVQFSLVAQSCPTLCDPMNCSMPGLPVHHQLLESIQTHVHWVGDAIQSSHPLLSPLPPALNLSQHQGPFQCVSSSHQVEEKGILHVPTAKQGQK